MSIVPSAGCSVKQVQKIEVSRACEAENSVSFWNKHDNTKSTCSFGKKLFNTVWFIQLSLEMVAPKVHLVRPLGFVGPSLYALWTFGAPLVHPSYLWGTPWDALRTFGAPLVRPSQKWYLEVSKMLLTEVRSTIQIPVVIGNPDPPLASQPVIQDCCFFFFQKKAFKANDCDNMKLWKDQNFGNSLA